MYEVILFYKYVTLNNPEEVKTRVRALAEKYELKGRCIVAEEGINGTFEGLQENTQQFVADILEDARLKDMNIKTSEGTGHSFPKLSVKVRKEIVGTRYPKEMANPEEKTTPHLPADTLREWYENEEDFVVIDMRNDYEFASGHFKNSIDPGMSASRDLPEVMPKLEQYKDKKVVTVCTGGVRCEKMSAYLMNSGFKNVYQLENGIHTYMEKYPGKDFLGTLYTFDNRVVMDFGGEREVIGTCKLCGNKTESYTNCANLPCHLHFLVCKKCTAGSTNVCCSDECSRILREVALSP